MQGSDTSRNSTCIDFMDLLSGPEEMNNTCRRKTYMEWWIKVPPYKFILHVTSLFTQKSKSLYLSPSLSP